VKRATRRCKKRKKKKKKKKSKTNRDGAFKILESK
jgi:hypothetical protein